MEVNYTVEENGNIDPKAQQANAEMTAQSSSKSSASVFMKYVRPCFAEFFIVLIFVFVGVCSVSGESSFIPLVHGFTITVLVFLAGEISGAHINPAVSVGVLLAGAITPFLALLYVLSQLLGAIAGAGFARAVLSKAAYDNIKGGAHYLSSDASVGRALLAEMLATSLLVLTVQMTAVDKKSKTSLPGIPIGFAVAIGIYGIGSISGGSLNPARSFGPAVVGSHWSDHYVYWIGPIFGAVLASAVYRLVLASPDRLLFCKGSDVEQPKTDVELGRM